MTNLYLITSFLFKSTGPAKEARRLVALHGAEGAIAEARACLRFAADYGAPGEETYWEAVLHILLKQKR